MSVDNLPVNELKILNIFGTLCNFDNAYYDDTTNALTTQSQAAAYFQRNVDVGGNLRMGVETIVTDSITGVISYTDSGENILVKKNGVTYILTPTILSYLSTITSNVQTQINNFVTGQSNDINSQTMKFYNAINTGGNSGIISIGNFTVPDYTGSIK